MKRVALTQALERKQAPAKGAVVGDACGGVAGAGRFEATDGPEERVEQLRERRLVDADQEEEELGQHEARGRRFGQAWEHPLHEARSRCLRWIAWRTVSPVLGFWGGFWVLGLACFTFVQEGCDGQDFVIELGLGELVGAWSDDDHDVGALGEGLEVSSKQITQEAFGAVALDCVADLPRRDDPETRRVFPKFVLTRFVQARCHEHQQMSRRDACAIFLDVQELRSRAEPSLSRKRTRTLRGEG